MAKLLALGHAGFYQTRADRVMPDLDKLTDDVTTKAAMAAGKNAAKRAIEDLLSSDEENAKREAEGAAQSKSRRNKLIVFSVVGLLILVGLFGLVVSYWQWFLLLGLLSAGGLYGWYRLRKRFGAKKDGVKKDRVKKDVDSNPDEVAATRGTSRLRVGEQESEAAAREEELAIDEQAIEDELAAMKARLDK